MMERRYWVLLSTDSEKEKKRIAMNTSVRANRGSGPEEEKVQETSTYLRTSVNEIYYC